MTEKQILDKVEGHLSKHGYSPKKIIPPKQLASKSPDYEVFLDGIMDFYSEVKSPLLKPNEATQMFHWTTSISKLRGFIHKAVDQFEAVDGYHKKPWVLIFTSDNMQLNWTNMGHAITGIVSFGNTIIKDLRGERYVEDTNEDVRKIDLFIWMQMGRDGMIYQIRFFVNDQPRFNKKSEEISNKLKPTSDDLAFNH